MSKKAAAERGTKRTCPSCEARFYDLGRDPMTCPMCQEKYAASAFATKADIEAAAALAAEKASRKAAAKKAAFEEAEAAEETELPEGAEVPDVETDDTAVEGEEETFLPEEEEDTDVSGYIEGGIEEGGEEET